MQPKQPASGQTDRIDVQYRLHFTSPFHFGTGLRAGLVHRAVARQRDGMPYVPGSTLKGVLRDQATQIAAVLGVAARTPHPLGDDDVGEFAPRSDIVARIFGSRVAPGEVFFDDALLCAEDRDFLTIGNPRRPRLAISPTEARTQVSMSRRTGTARRGLLFTSEYGVGQLSFDGGIYGHVPRVPMVSAPERSYTLTLLLAAVFSLERIGANTSAGAGRVTCSIRSLTVNGAAADADAYMGDLSDFEIYELSLDDLEGGQ
ncbi:hypothetical protein EKD04_025365 [Chloroflexales bacterium ZM16-3]|nr:hypothetical protein [Chloroflexales bacterium ZM16-3]